MAPLLAATQNASMFDPVSPPAESIRDLSILVSRHHRLYLHGRRRGAALLHRPLPAQPRDDDRESRRRSTAASRSRSPGRRRRLLIVFVLVLVTTRTLWEVNVDAPSPAGRQRPVRHRGRPPVVVGVSLRPLQRPELGFTTANELHIPAGDDGARPARLPDPEVGRRVSQLLGAAAGGQDRPDSRPHQPHVVSDRRARSVPRPVRRVLRHAARQHAAPRGRRPAGRFRALAGQREGSRGRSDRELRRRRRRRRSSSRSRASIATACAARRPRGPMRRT